MVRFCIGICDKLKKDKCGFLWKVFNFTSAHTLACYDSIGGDEPDGILFSVLHSIQNEYKLAYERDEWLKMVSVKFDVCHIDDRIKHDPHTNQLVGFAHDAFDKDILLKNLNKLTKTEVNNSKATISDNRAKQYLIFIINRWGEMRSH